MTLKRRIRIDEPGAPELLGLVLLCTILVGSIISFVSYLNSPVPTASAKADTAAVPLTEEGLRRVLQNSQLSFGYTEESGSSADFMDRASAGIWTGSESVPPIVVSRGDGAFTVSLGHSPSPRTPSEIWGIASPLSFRSESAFGSWFAVTLLAYVATLIYFTTIYPVWRREGGLPSSPAPGTSGPSEGRLF